MAVDQQWWESVSVLVRLFSKEVALVTFTFSEILRQVLSILRVPLRTHQEDESQVKSALPVRDFTQISSFPLKRNHSGLPKSVSFSKAFFLKLYLWIHSTQDPKIFTGQTEPQTPFKSQALTSLAYQYLQLLPLDHFEGLH